MLSFKCTLACATVALLLTVIFPANADTYCDFESGIGKNAQPIAGSINGFSFSTTAGGSIYYADINSGYYAVTSDNGKVYENGDYFMGGNVAAFAANISDIGKIAFTKGVASYLTIGYSAGFPLTLEAYNASGVLLSSITGAVNTKSSGGTQMGYLTVTGQNMAYVYLRGTGGYWMIDNLSTDAPVPEPSAICGIAVGIVGLLIRRRR